MNFTHAHTIFCIDIHVAWVIFIVAHCVSMRSGLIVRVLAFCLQLCFLQGVLCNCMCISCIVFSWFSVRFSFRASCGLYFLLIAIDGCHLLSA